MGCDPTSDALGCVGGLDWYVWLFIAAGVAVTVWGVWSISQTDEFKPVHTGDFKPYWR